MRMIDEKEKKLNIFLASHGISNSKYYLSWFLSYLFLSIIPSFIYFFLIFFFKEHYILVLVNIFLFILALFSTAFFFVSIISSIKKSASIVKLYNFGSTLLRCAIVLPISSKTIKNYICLYTTN